LERSRRIREVFFGGGGGGSKRANRWRLVGIGRSLGVGYYIQGQEGRRLNRREKRQGGRVGRNVALQENQG